jgi:hypothetical protein
MRKQPEGLILSRVRVGVQVHDVDQVHDANILGQVLYRGPGPNKEERGKFKQVEIKEVHVIYSSRQDHREHHIRPEKVR